MSTVSVKDGRAYLVPKGSYSGGSVTSDYIFEVGIKNIKEDVQRNPKEIEVPSGNPESQTWDAFIIELGKAKKHFEIQGIISSDNSENITRNQMRNNLEILSGVDETIPKKSELDFLYKNEGVTREFTVTVNKFTINETSKRNQTDKPPWDVTISLIVGTFKG